MSDFIESFFMLMFGLIFFVGIVMGIVNFIDWVQDDRRTAEKAGNVHAVEAATSTALKTLEILEKNQEELFKLVGEKKGSSNTWGWLIIAGISVLIIGLISLLAFLMQANSKLIQALNAPEMKRIKPSNAITDVMAYDMGRQYVERY